MSFAARLKKTFVPEQPAESRAAASPRRLRWPTHTVLSGSTLRAVCRCGTELVLAVGWVASSESRQQWIDEAAEREGWREGRCAACAEAERLEKKTETKC